MTGSSRRAWLGAALLVGVVYLLIGRLFALPATHVHGWRLAAWLVSGVAYAVHIAYEHFKLRNSSRLVALHVALAVAIGAMGLAMTGMIRSLVLGSALRPAWLLALVLWPAFTAIPAFVCAFLAGAVLARIPRRAE